MYGYIYKTTNLINGKIYIGQHKASQFDDWYIGSGKILWKAINKYGWNNFKCELLLECNSREELNFEEIRLIAEYNSTDRSIGYNISLGGGIPSEEIIRKYLIGNKRAAGPMSPEVYAAHVKRCQERGKDPVFCKKLSDSQNKRYENPESHKILSEAHLGKPSNTKGKFWITNGIKNSLVNDEKDIPEGWYKGRVMREGFSEAVSKSHADFKGSNSPNYNKKYVNNGIRSFLVKEDELDYYLSNGYVKGLLKNKGVLING